MVAGLALPVLPTEVGIHVCAGRSKGKTWMPTFVGMTAVPIGPPILLHAMISMVTMAV